MVSSLQRLARSLWAPAPTHQDRLTAGDQRLAQRLHQLFEAGPEPLETHGIQFYVQHGVVTLYGVVRHEHERGLFVGRVRQAPGVRGVVDRLHVVEWRFQPAEATHA